MRAIFDPRLQGAFAAVDRRGFLRVAQRRAADEDRPLPIGHGQTNSQPTTVANMLELLDVRRGNRVLDVGTGSGWTTALLAHLVGRSGRVIGVELVPELARWGASNLARCRSPWAVIHPSAPGVLGDPDEAPYDRILVSAGAAEVPQALVDQLAADGLLVIPVKGRMLAVRRLGDATLKVTEHGRYAFVPLQV